MSLEGAIRNQQVKNFQGENADVLMWGRGLKAREK